MNAPLAFVDVETTGLDPERHEIWEVGLILRREGVDIEYLWQLPVDLGRADPMALSIGRWYERRWEWAVYPGMRVSPLAREDVARADAAVEGEEKFVVPWERLDDWAALFAELTDGAHLVGAVVSFDEKRLERLLRACKACPTWHYHIIDVEALAAGWLGAEAAGIERAENEMRAAPLRSVCRPPWDSEELSRAVGVDPERFDRHTALGDAKWARAVYDAVMG